VSNSPVDDSELLGVPWLGRTENLASIVSGLDVDEVFLADSSLTPLETVALALACDGAGASCKVVSDFSGIIARREGVTSLGHLPVVDLSRSTPGPAQHLMKTCLDYGLGVILVIVSTPVILLAMAGLRLSGTRKLFVREERVGQGGRYFYTTRLNTSPGQCFIGKALRRTGLDRLPRLIAVLKGQMSLVGPRGEPPVTVAGYPSWERLLLEVKPGLTGLWLVGRAGDIDKGTDVEYDFYYLRNRSFLLDLVILIRTLPALWRSEGKKGA
jgi:lipopolysaccharide/colanic/teichoic acid biosynthesis glycosyltransferase